MIINANNLDVILYDTVCNMLLLRRPSKKYMGFPYNIPYNCIGIFSLLLSLLLYTVLQHTNGTHPGWGGQSALLSLLTEMLISRRHTLTNTPRITVNQISGHPRALSN